MLYNTVLAQPPWSLHVTLRVLSTRWGSIAFNQVSYIFSSHYWKDFKRNSL